MPVAAKTVFYMGDYDTNKAKEIIANDPDIYIQRFHYIGKGVYANSTSGVSTLTPAVSPAWTPDLYISTSAFNLYVMDDNAKVCRALITDNDANSVTFDETACLKEEDEVTAGTWTAGQTYDFYVLTPCNERTYGYFFGQITTAELAINNEYAKYVSRVPKETLYKNLQSRYMELTIPYIHTANEDLQDMSGLETYGSQTGYAKYGIGAEETGDVHTNYWRLTFVGYDNGNNLCILVVRKACFDLSGNFFNKADSGHRAYPMHADLIADQFYPKDARYLHLQLQD